MILSMALPPGATTFTAAAPRRNAPRAAGKRDDAAVAVLARGHAYGAMHDFFFFPFCSVQPPPVPFCTSRSSVTGGVLGKDPALPCATTRLSPSLIAK